MSLLPNTYQIKSIMNTKLKYQEKIKEYQDKIKEYQDKIKEEEFKLCHIQIDTICSCSECPGYISKEFQCQECNIKVCPNCLQKEHESDCRMTKINQCIICQYPNVIQDEIFCINCHEHLVYKEGTFHKQETNPEFNPETNTETKSERKVKWIKSILPTLSVYNINTNERVRMNLLDHKINHDEFIKKITNNYNKQNIHIEYKWLLSKYLETSCDVKEINQKIDQLNLIYNKSFSHI